MITDQSNSTRLATPRLPADAAERPLVTLFGLPKPFVGHIGVIQRNAIKSWTLLGDQVEVILFGDEVGTAEYAQTLGVRHVADIRRNAQGTPLLNDVFEQADRCAAGRVMLYANCDIIFLHDLIDAILSIDHSRLSEFLMIGRRIDLDLSTMVDFEELRWSDRISESAARAGTLAPVVCKDYFGFPRGQHASIPAFAVGRGNWDNWMVHQAAQNGRPVIDCTDRVTAIHQQHDYAHLPNGRREAYVNGAEAEENRRLAGGRHLVTGCGATWRLASNGPVKLKRPASAAFLGDLPRFLRLLRELFVGGKPHRSRRKAIR